MMHWTVDHFKRLKREGYNYAFLRHGSSSFGKPEHFIGMHDISELHEILKDDGFEEYEYLTAIDPNPYAKDRFLVRTAYKDGTVGVTGYFVDLRNSYNDDAKE